MRQPNGSHVRLCRRLPKNGQGGARNTAPRRCVAPTHTCSCHRGLVFARFALHVDADDFRVAKNVGDVAAPEKAVGAGEFVKTISAQGGTEVERLLDDPSPLVRGAAVWALSRLAPRDRFEQSRREHGRNEADPVVAEEWVAG